MIRYVETIMFLKHLKKPYNTNCRDYNVTKRFCFLSCRKETSDVEKCGTLCNQKDCEIIERDYHCEYRNTGHLRTIEFGKDGNLFIQSHPLETFGGLILLIMGITSSFVGLSLFVIIHFMIDVATRKYKQQYPQSDFSQDKLGKTALGAFIIFAVAFISVNTYWFNHRRAATNAFIGPATYNMKMTFRLCYEHNLEIENAKFNQLENKTPTINQLFRVSAENFKYMRAGFVNNRKCFFGSTDLSNNYREAEILQVQSIFLIPFYFASSIDGTIPIGKDQIRVKNSLSFIADLSKFYSNPSFTDCQWFLDYAGSKEHCYQSCVKKLFINAFGLFPARIMVMDETGLNLTNTKIPDEIMATCRYNCYSRACKTNELHFRKSSFHSSNMPNLKILRTGSTKSIQENDSETLSEHIVHLGILFSTFTGLCVYSLIRRIKRIPKSFAKVITFCGIIFHIIVVSWQFFSYNMQTSVHVAHGDIIDIPCITLFAYKNRYLKNQETNSSDCLFISQDLSYAIEKILMANSSRYHYAEFIQERIRNESVRFGGHSGHSVFKSILINLGSLRKAWPSFSSVPENIAFELQLNPNFRECLGPRATFATSISLNECNYWPDFVSSSTVRMEKFDLAYNVAVIKKLSVPYDKFCQLREEDVRDWQSCIHHKLMGINSTARNVQQNEIQAILSTPDGKQIIKDCVTGSPSVPPCITKSYSTVDFSRPNAEMNHHVAFFGPNRVSSTEYFPIMPFSSYFLYLLSIIGLWCGITLCAFCVYLYNRSPNSCKPCHNQSGGNSLVVPFSDTDTDTDIEEGRIVLGYGSLRPAPGMMFVMRRLDGNNSNSPVEEIVTSQDIE